MKNLKIYLYTLAVMGILSCSSEDVKDETGTEAEMDNLISQNFISTIESWINVPQTSVEWIHDINSDGELVKSTLYEKYPRRVLWEIEYLEYNEDGLPTEYDKAYYSFGEPVDFLTWQVSYNENGTIAGITTLTHGWSFSQLDDEKRVKSVLNLDDTEEFLNREVFEYDENGNYKSLTRYSTESGNEESDIVGQWDYTFTHFGDWETGNYLDGETGSTTEYTYSYREDYTREGIGGVTQSDGNPDTIVSIEFDEEEKIIYERVTYGDNRWEYFYSNGNLEVVEYYHQDTLWDVQTFAEDGSKEWKIINTDDGSYKIEYHDADGTVYKVEYYDADDNLINTEHYSRSIQINKPPTGIEDNLYLEIYPGRVNSKK